MFKYIVVGAGFAGSVIAERVATQLKEKVLVIERRNHIGGNCYDYTNDSGIIIHKYGPHAFHTNFRHVFDYLSNFTDWRIYHHRVLAYVDGKKVPIPFNFDSMDMLFPAELSGRLKNKLLERFGYGSKISILELRKIEDDDIRFLANFIYEKIFLNYTLKQWGIKPEEMAPEVTARVPIYISRDDRYFQDRYQVIPEKGYTKIFEKMLSHPNIKLLLNTDFRELMDIDLESGKIYFMGQEFNGKFIFTGMIDELFNYVFGVLPYRSLRFDFKTLKVKFFQEVATVNYPNDYDFTRITEFKHFHPIDVEETTVAYEYPEDYKIGKIPYYPVLNEEALGRYNRYIELASRFKNLILVGRLADYRYYDMDDVVNRALDVFEEAVR